METQYIRLRLVVQYDGSGFHGWQYQPALRTVQGELQAALSRLADTERSVLGSGRTDTGVHARGQVAAVDMPGAWTPLKLHRSLNSILPSDIWVESVSEAAEDFHPRYDAVARSYEYAVGCAPGANAPFHRRWCWALGGDLDESLLKQAADLLPGRHSFRAFAKSGQPERGEFCTVAKAGWSGWEFGLCFRITANRYLHHMVRYLVGTMVDVARDRRPIEEMAGLLAGDPSLQTSPPAPPQGLFLTHVEYPVGKSDTLEPEASDSRRIAPA